MKFKKLNNLHWLLMLFAFGVCESSNSPYNQNYHSTGNRANNKVLSERVAQLRKARSSPNQINNLTSSLAASATSLQKVTFLPEDSFEPIKKQQYPHFYHHSKYGSKKNNPMVHNSNIKRDLSESPIGFLNAVLNDHATSSSNQDTDTVRYPPNKAFKSSSMSSPSSNEQPQSFSRRQRDFSETPINNPTSSASEPSESMNSDDNESESGSPFSSGGSTNSGSSSHDNEPVDSNEDFPSSPHSSSSSDSSSSSNPGSSSGSSLGDEPYDGFGPNTVDAENSARGNSLDDNEQPHSHHSPINTHQSLGSRPSLPYSSSPYALSPFGPSSSLGYRNVYSGGPPMSFPGYRPMTSQLTYPMISSASGSYKAMSSENYPAGPMTATRYRTYGSTGSFPSTDDMSGNSAMYSPFSFDSFPSSSDTFGSTPTAYGFKSSYAGLSNNDLMGLNNNNWYLNQQQYLPLMMKQAGYPMMPGAYGMQYQTTTQAPTEQESSKDKEKEGNEGKKKNRLRFNLNRLQAIRLNNLKLPSLFNWHKNSTTTTTPSSVN